MVISLSGTVTPNHINSINIYHHNEKMSKIDEKHMSVFHVLT